MENNNEKINLDDSCQIINKKDCYYIVNIRKIKNNNYKYFLKRKEKLDEIY